MIRRFITWFAVIALGASASGCSFGMGKKGAGVDGVMAGLFTVSTIVVVAADDGGNCDHGDTGCVGKSLDVLMAVPLGVLAVGYGVAALYGNAQDDEPRADAKAPADPRRVEIDYEREWSKEVARRRNSRKGVRSGMKGE